MGQHLQPIATQLDTAEYLVICRKSFGPKGEDYWTSCIRGMKRALARAREMNSAGWFVTVQGTGNSEFRREFPA
jgi:hypothetical protein